MAFNKKLPCIAKILQGASDIIKIHSFSHFPSIYIYIYIYIYHSLFSSSSVHDAAKTPCKTKNGFNVLTHVVKNSIPVWV